MLVIEHTTKRGIRPFKEFISWQPRDKKNCHKTAQIDIESQEISFRSETVSVSRNKMFFKLSFNRDEVAICTKSWTSLNNELTLRSHAQAVVFNYRNHWFNYFY